MIKKSFLVFTAFMAVAGILNLSGCERMVQSAVVEPKDQSRENPKENHDETEEITDSERTEGMTVAQQVMVPQRYQVDETALVSIPTEEGSEDVGNAETPSSGITFTLKANAEVEVPDVKDISKKKAVPQKADETEMKKIFDKLSQGGKIEKTNSSQGSVSTELTLKGIPYICQYSTEGNESLSFWWKGEVSGDTESGAVDEAKIFSEARAENQTVTEEEALDFIKSLGLGEFQIAYTEAEHIEGENGSVQKDSFQLERVVEGVPVNYVYEHVLPVYEKAASWADEDGTVHEPEDRTWQEELMKIHYTAGTLKSFAYTAALDISDLSDEKLFLLPFEEIQQIFRDSLIPQIAASRTNPKLTVIGTAADGSGLAWTQYPSPESASMEFTVTKVKLGYMRQRENGSAEQGILTPVWDFYGTWKAKEPDGQGGYEEHTMDHEAVSLMTIDACTGSVVQRVLGY